MTTTTTTTTTTTMRMPAEWAEHEGTLMAWPTRADLWGAVLDAAKDEYAEVARAVARFEPVLMVAPPGAGAEARERCGQGVEAGQHTIRQPTDHPIEVIELPIDDSWFRDSGPIFVTDGAGGRAGVDFRFNAWGGKHSPWDADDRISALLLERLGVERVVSSLILEGGSITVDGEGTLITTEQCLLHPNRNPGWTRERIEDELKTRLGVTTVIWLPYGGAEDFETDGHVDGCCAFIAPATVIVQLPEDPAHPDYERCRANLEILRTSRDAQGRTLTIIPVPQSNRVDVDGEEVEVGYLNFYLPNGGCVVPIAGVPADEGALAALAKAMPDREVVGVRTRTIAYGGGGIHCITQQIPQIPQTPQTPQAPQTPKAAAI
ncbi:agmatine deiminase family protein [Catenulispora pinisilvae]|uniref:agmatine deiminase family protein n=1 Tax=Catenulispora pinisilvae TaxID=2705253 RepID=UPI00189283EF|nr:agmatine deiminase family protein [Catenulispora pinisilvae]